MKKLFFAAMLCMPFLSPSVHAQSAGLSSILTSYYQVKDALVGGDAKAVATAAGDLLKTINGIDMTALTPKDHQAFMALQDKLAYDSRHMSESTAIDHQREHFTSLSANLFKLAKQVQLSQQPIYEDYCPMKKATWLSNDTAIKNPYFGSSMLTCGKVSTDVETGIAPMKRLFFCLLACMAGQMAFSQAPHRVIYHLYISDTIVNYTGKSRHAIAVNGSLPGPTLTFTEGDTAVIYVHNNMMMATSVHWHGLIVPNRYDGVSYLTSPPIGPMQTYVATFPIVQNGTYWYHSHTMLQEQIGLYGAIVIHKRPAVAAAGGGMSVGSELPGGAATAPEKEYTVLLSDWTNERPYEVQRSLHYATDWYAIRKGSVQDYAAAIRQGYFRTKLANEWKRMLPMDVSDVAYDRFLVNGRPRDEQPMFHAGDRVRLRIINGSSSTYFWLRYSGGKMAVVASDGKDVEPVEVDRMIIGVSETYDVVVTIPADGKYEFQATAEDRTGSTSLWLGEGPAHGLSPLPALNYFEGMKMMNGMMKMNGDLNSMGMAMNNQVMDMNAVMYPEAGGDAVGHGAGMDTAMRGMSGSGITLNYGMLRSPVKTTLPDSPVRLLHFNLTGNMNRYVWTINNKAVSETDRILIRRGENVRIILYNGTMMRHPMHLHGHFFRVLNGQGEYAPLKEVVDIMPMETDTLEFAATESGDWFFHCHILYHMMSGMGRIFHYVDSPPDSIMGGEMAHDGMGGSMPMDSAIGGGPQPGWAAALRKVYADDRDIRPMARVGLESNGSDGEAMLADTRYRLETEWRLGTDAAKGYESESHFGRYLGKMQYWLPYVGWDFRYRRSTETEKNLFGQTDTKNHRNVVCAGIQYTLPLLLVIDWRVDMKGNLRLQLGREDVPVTNRLRFTFMVNTDKEYMAGFRYIITKYIGLSTHYDSDMGFGAGVTVNY